MTTPKTYKRPARTAFDSFHDSKGWKASALLYKGAEAGKIVAAHPGSVCVVTVCIHTGPLASMPSTTGRAGGGGYDKHSAAFASACRAAIDRVGDVSHPTPDNHSVILRTMPDLHGLGWSACREWLGSIGYQVIDVL